MKTAFLLLLAVAGLVLAGCAGDQDMIKADLNYLKQENYDLRKDVDSLKTETARKQDTRQQQTDEKLNAIKQSQADLITQVSGIDNDLSTLRGNFEEDRHFTGKSLSEESARLDNLEKKVSDEEMRIAALETALKNATISQRQPPPPASAQQEYDSAYDLFKQDKYPEARAAFKEFIKQNPGEELAGNAQFWIGETYYKSRDYENAILAYDDVIKKYKDSRKVPAAYLKQALSFLELKDSQDRKVGRAILNDIIRKYPDSEEAKAAKTKLSELKKSK